MARAALVIPEFPVRIRNLRYRHRVPMKLRLVLIAALFGAGIAYGADIRPTPAPPIIGATSYLMIDATTGHELASLQPDKAVPPASLTKLMTAYVVFTALKQEQIQLQDQVTVSEKAWRTPGSRSSRHRGWRPSTGRRVRDWSRRRRPGTWWRRIPPLGRPRDRRVGSTRVLRS